MAAAGKEKQRKCGGATAWAAKSNTIAKSQIKINKQITK
jgi:hypothetical protein